MSHQFSLKSPLFLPSSLVLPQFRFSSFSIPIACKVILTQICLIPCLHQSILNTTSRVMFQNEKPIMSFYFYTTIHSWSFPSQSLQFIVFPKVANDAIYYSWFLSCTPFQFQSEKKKRMTYQSYFFQIPYFWAFAHALSLPGIIYTSSPRQVLPSFIIQPSFERIPAYHSIYVSINSIYLNCN